MTSRSPSARLVACPSALGRVSVHAAIALGLLGAVGACERPLESTAPEHGGSARLPVESQSPTATSGQHGASAAAGDEGPATDLATSPATSPADAGADGSAQIGASQGAAVEPAGTPSTSSKLCPSDMLEVQGDYCPNVTQKCLRWIDPKTKLRCAEFAPEVKCNAKTLAKHFCIDTYEYPNQAGATPEVMKTWYEAKSACKAQGKRLCTGSEWTLACEGHERLPYPYGFVRDEQACNIDKPRITPNEKALGTPALRDAEVERLDQRVSSGSAERCVSPYGVRDMTGNVDEWVVNESGKPYKSGSKGGYWGPVRTRCRPMTTAHYEMFSFYQLGFRCCAETSPQPEDGSGAPAAAAEASDAKSG